MANTFKVGDHVTWNSEAGHVSGRIGKVHPETVSYKGYVTTRARRNHSTSSESDKTDHIALHKTAAPKLLRRTIELQCSSIIPVATRSRENRS